MTKTILIVEDEFIVADDLQLTLRNAGYTICGIADNVVEAREIIESKKPSLILLDIHLKGKANGIELAKELKEQNIAFVYLSANSNQKILEEAKATEPYGFLVKPFREKDLLVMIDIAFYRHENSMEARWRKDLLLQKELFAVEKSREILQQKLLNTAKALQQHIPFDLMAGKFKLPGSNNYFGVSFLRIGFDEYQTIGVKELSVITGLKENEVESIMINSPVDYTPAIYNSEGFKKSLTKNAMRELLAKQFNFLSALTFPVIIGDGNIASIVFFRKSNNGFATDQLSLLSRMQMLLVAIIESFSAHENDTLANTGKDKAHQHNKFKNIIGNSSSLLNVLDLVEQVATVDTSVLILGESGTGKEKIASCIHELSPRKNRPFIKINCSALPPTLIESELFGHEKGAFTNALDKRIGKFEQADTGTIFLDEIGDMPPELQVKLLRVLQEKEIERVGGKQSIKVDVRVIAATNRNLQSEMAAGRFRLDLYYRLNVFPITLPPLRERKEDIKELSEYFAASFAKKFNRTYTGISDPMLQQLKAYDFPGNIRELENIIEQSVILNYESSQLSLRQQLVSNNNHQDSFPPNSIKTIDDIRRLQRQTEIEHISAILSKTRGRIRGKDGAAELLNEKPTTLESRLLKLGIKKEDFQ